MSDSIGRRGPLPTPRQLAYQDWEFGLFLHFGIRTFYEGHRDCDGQAMSPTRFDPTALDCEQWVRTAAAAGVRYMVLTAKHHDGYANWPSRYTDFSVASSPWKGGHGDVVGEFVAACRRHDMHVGLYYSPADASCPVYSDPRAYDDYFIDQVSELLQPYGPIDILWFDGAGSAGHVYDWPRIMGEVRRMQPDVLIFNMGDPDFRWVGNESGLAPTPCWNTVADTDAWQQPAERPEPGGQWLPLKWLPAECDCMLRYSNWFYSDQDEHTVKSLAELLGLYAYSVGRGCNLLLNIGPDRRGLLPDRDAARLLEFGAELRRRFAHPLAELADGCADAEGWSYRPAAPLLLDHVVVQERIELGEHVRRFRVQILPTHGSEPITVWEGYNIGHKAICHFPLVAAREVRLRIVEADGPVALRSVALYNSAE